MKAVAIFKWAPNPDDALVRVDGTVNWSTARHDVGDDDHAAMACAMAAANGDEVVGLCVGGGDTSFAAARGAERTVVLEGFPVPTDSMTMARALVEEIKGVEDAGLVAMGDADWDPMVAPLVAALLGWPLLTAVDEVAIADGGLVVTLRHGMGTQDVAVTGPVVVDVAARREEEEKPGMRQVLAARKKPSDTKTVEGDRSAFSSRGTRLPEATSSRLFDGSDPADAVEQLVSALKADGVL